MKFSPLFKTLYHAGNLAGGTALGMTYGLDVSDKSLSYIVLALAMEGIHINYLSLKEGKYNHKAIEEGVVMTGTGIGEVLISYITGMII
mgnify:CR=1 FL=1